MDILQSILGLLGQFVDILARWVDLARRPDVLAVLVGLLIAMGTSNGLKLAPFMQRRESAESKKARAWYLRAFAFAVGAAFTALLWPGSLAAKLGVGAATGFSAPLVYDLGRFVLGKFGLKK